MIWATAKPPSSSRSGRKAEPSRSRYGLGSSHQLIKHPKCTENITPCVYFVVVISLNQLKKPAHYVSNEVLNIFISISSFSIEICEAYFYGGLVHGAVPQAEEELQHPAAGGFQTAVRLER